jgi:hypothetical protein
VLDVEHVPESPGPQGRPGNDAGRPHPAKLKTGTGVACDGHRPVTDLTGLDPRLLVNPRGHDADLAESVRRGTSRPLINGAGGRGISRFSRMEVPYMPWFFDHAGSDGASRYRRRRCCLPPFRQRGHPGIHISWLDSPACTCPCQRFAAALTDDDA